MTAQSLKRSALKPAPLPPCVNRQNHAPRPDGTRSSPTDAATVLANVASRAASPRRHSSSNSPLNTPSESPQRERRTSWEECMQKREGYISFPDFDALREREK